MHYDGLEMFQISDGLTQSAAACSAIAYDKANGVVFVSYLSGPPKAYGETGGKICLSVFAPSQPQNIRHRVIDTGIGQTRGVVCSTNYLVGDKKNRMLFTTTRGEIAAYYRDYDFNTDTVSERTEVFLRTENGDVRIDRESYKEYLASKGFAVELPESLLINKAAIYNNEVYTSISADGTGYPILCKVEDNILIPFAICPELMTYEFRYMINGDGIFGVYRIPPDDHKTGHAAFTVSKDGGKTWNTQVYEDGVQSRPDIMEYYGKPLMTYNYKSDKSVENFPNMHNFRNAIKMIYDGEVILDLFTKYGIVEYDVVSISGDLYMSLSNCPQALSFENGMAWIEDGIPVEQGKEAVQWMKIGYLLKDQA